MKIKYLPQDNEARINGGICRYKGRPYHLDLLGPSEARLSKLWVKEPDEKGIEVKLNDDDLDVSSPPLGWLNTKVDAFYVLRKAERSYKQTLRPSLLEIYRPDMTKIRASEVHSLIYSEYGEKMFLGEYVSVNSAVTAMSNKRRSVAISRDVCLYRRPIDGTVGVLYKLEDVGTLDLLRNTVDIPKAELAWIPSRLLQRFDWKVN